MKGTNLKKAILRNCNLFMVEFQDANLQDADLGGVDLQGANLNGANLQGAELFGTNFKGANLAAAIGVLRDQLEEAEIDQTTRLPEDLT